MLVKDVINRLKDTRGFINEKKEYEIDCECDEDELTTMDYLLEGIEEAIKLIQDLQAK